MPDKLFQIMFESVNVVQVFCALSNLFHFEVIEKKRVLNSSCFAKWVS